MNKKQKIIFVSLIILLAAFLRFFRIGETAPFLGDQGRDLLLIRESLLANKIPLTSQPTSQGINAGPAYFYLIIPFLLLFKFHPWGPILFFTLMGVVTCFIISKLGERLFGFIPALMTALVYATSPLAIERTRGFWNPIPLPLLSILFLLSLYQLQEKNKLHWFPLLGFLVGVIIQPHPSAYFILFLVIGWWLYFIFKKTSQKERKRVIKWSAVGGLCLLLPLLPYLLFQWQNDFVDFKKIILILFETLLVNGQDFSQQTPLLSRFIGLFSQQFQVLTSSQSMTINLFLGIILLVFLFLKRERSILFWPIFLTGWFIGGLILLSLYPLATHPHYASFIWILPFIFLGFFLAKLEKFLPSKVIIFLVLCLVLFQIKNYFLHLTPANDLLQTELAARAMAQQTKNQPFSLLLDSPRSPSDAHFRYFLALGEVSLLKIDDPEVEKLVFICDHQGCLNPQALEGKTFTDTECLPECPPLDQLKTISLEKWVLVESQKILRQKLYFFQRKD